MKRRTFLAGFAATSTFGSSGHLFSTNRSYAASNATPVPTFAMQSAALLIMDYQPAWIETLADGDALLARAADAISIARSAGLRVAYVRVGFTPADYAAVPEQNVIFHQLAGRPGLLDEDAPQTAVDSRVAPEPGEKAIRKTRVGAFARTDLDGWLRGMGIDTLVLAGISTSGVVLSTVCDAADRDYRLIVLADACADQDPEIHDLLIHKVFPQRAQVITVAQLPETLS